MEPSKLHETIFTLSIYRPVMRALWPRMSLDAVRFNTPATVEEGEEESGVAEGVLVDSGAD